MSGAPVFRRALRARVVDLGDVRLLEDVLPHLIFLRLLEGLQVHPPDVVLALAAVHVRDRVQPGDEQPVLGRARHVVDHAVEEEGLAGAAAEGLRDEVVDAREVGAALDAGVDVAAVEVVDMDAAHIPAGGVRILRARGGRRGGGLFGAVTPSAR